MERDLPIAIVIAFGALTFATSPGIAAPQSRDAMAQAAGQASASVQNRTKRARPKVSVRPLYPRQNFHSFYPPPYGIAYPGPNAVRQCVDGYVTERRPSGSVVVPRMRCWWVQR
jgi:hypothetical protein